MKDEEKNLTVEIKGIKMKDEEKNLTVEIKGIDYPVDKAVFDLIHTISKERDWLEKGIKLKAGIPRRLRIDLNADAELVIYRAIEEVEKLGADGRLTKAVILLDDAKELVGDFVDRQ